MKNKTILDSFWYKGMSYLTWFAQSSLYFLICNLPVIISFFLYGTNLFHSGALLLFLTLLPIGPSFTALNSVNNLLIQNNDVSVTKTFFESLKSDFKQSFTVTFLVLLYLFITLFSLSIIPINSSLNILKPLMYVLLFWLVVLCTYIFPLIARYHMSLLKIFQVSIVLFFGKIHKTLLNLGILIAATLLIDHFLFPAMILVPAISSFAIMFNLKNVFTELEKKK